MDQQNILTMNHRYPFDSNLPNPSIQYVKLRRKFQQQQLTTLKTKLHNHYNITHPSIIKIEKAFESKKKRYFDIFFEWIPNTFRSFARFLSYAELQQRKLQLLSLCSYLISIHIHPIITEDLIGITAHKQIKLYVDVDYSPVVGSVQELIRAKEIEISNIFKLYQRASLFQSPSTTVIANDEVFHGLRPNKSSQLIASVKLQAQKLANTYIPKEISTNTQTINAGNFITYRQNNLINQVQPIKQKNQSSEKIIYEVKQDGSLKSSSKNLLKQQANQVNTSNNKSMKPEKDVNDPLQDLQREYNHLTNNDTGLGANDKETPRQYRIEMMRQPRIFKMHENNQISEEEQISIVDTYKQQLGSEKKMPKIRNSDFRQTTKEPPSIHIPLVTPSQQKNRMSSGNSDRLPLLRHQPEEKVEESFKTKNIPLQTKPPRGDYKNENAYYYQEAFGFGFQKNDPLTREFISLFEDGGLNVEQEKVQAQPPDSQKQNDEESKIDEVVYQSHLEEINKKVKSALQSSMKTLELFTKFKISKAL